MNWNSAKALIATLFLMWLPPWANGESRNASAGEARLGEGRDLYNYYCYQCHGYAGDAHTQASQFLIPPPRNFRSTSPDKLRKPAMLAAVREGKPGTGMKSFARLLSERQIEAVVDYVRNAFMTGRSPNERYHTAQNGWPQHDRYRPAFPFVTGEIFIDSPSEDQNANQRAGRRLFLSTCTSCHEGKRLKQDTVIWESRVVSFPRNPATCSPCHKTDMPGLAAPDGHQSAAFLSMQRKPSPLPNPTTSQARGQALFLANCAFCHAQDGTGRNWIGTFLEPHPRNLADPIFMSGMDADRLTQVIRNGIPGTSMPAWNSTLSPAEIAHLIAFIKGGFPGPESNPSVLPSTPLPTHSAIDSSSVPPVWRRIPGLTPSGAQR